MMRGENVVRMEVGLEEGGQGTEREDFTWNGSLQIIISLQIIR